MKEKKEWMKYWKRSDARFWILMEMTEYQQKNVSTLM